VTSVKCAEQGSRLPPQVSPTAVKLRQHQLVPMATTQSTLDRRLALCSR